LFIMGLLAKRLHTTGYTFYSLSHIKTYTII